MSRRQPAELKRRFSIAGWIERRAELVALVIVALGFVLRLVSATLSHLHPDEAWNYLTAHQTSLAQVYRAGLTDAHPPLFFLLLYFWRFLGDSEFVLRLMSVLAGTAGLWVGFKWLAYRSGRVAGLIGLLLLAFSPTLVSLSAEVRSYATFLLAIAGALYCLERGLRERSERMLLWFALALCAANLIHYAAVWFTIAVGLYALIRIVRERLPGRWTRLWVAVQVVIVALWAFLYVTHIRTLRGSGKEQFAREGWLRTSYFHPGQDRFLPFLDRTLGELFAYLFSSHVAGLLAQVMFLAGVVMLLTRYRLRPGLPAGNPDPLGTEDWSFGILLIAAFAVNALAALAGLYPFGGTRDSVFLVLFVVAGIGVLPGRLAGRRLGDFILLSVAVIAPILGFTVAFADWGYRSAAQNQESVTRAMDYVRGSIPRGSLLFVDRQTGALLGYYLGRDQVDDQTIALLGYWLGPDQTKAQSSTSGDKFVELQYGGYRVISSKRWTFTPDDFWSELRAMKQRYGLGTAIRVWVVDRGQSLARLYPDQVYPGLCTFGGALSVFQVKEGIQSEIQPGQAVP